MHRKTVVAAVIFEYAHLEKISQAAHFEASGLFEGTAWRLRMHRIMMQFDLERARTQEGNG